MYVSKHTFYTGHGEGIVNMNSSDQLSGFGLMHVDSIVRK